MARARRYLGRPLSVLSQLINLLLSGRSVTPVDLAEIISRKCVRNPLQTVSN